MSEGDRQTHEIFARGVRGSLAGVEEALYVIVGLLLLGTAVLVAIGAIDQVVNSLKPTHPDYVQSGVNLLDKILLLLIIAELVHTLRHVVLRGEIDAEPFLFVGLIAVVRRILIETANLENQTPSTHQLWELGLLGLLTIVLAVAIYLVRRSDQVKADTELA
jgi:uncharacterized membrane protein (DUF373 family)